MKSFVQFLEDKNKLGKDFNDTYSYDDYDFPNSSSNIIDYENYIYILQEQVQNVYNQILKQCNNDYRFIFKDDISSGKYDYLLLKVIDEHYYLMKIKKFKYKYYHLKNNKKIYHNDYFCLGTIEKIVNKKIPNLNNVKNWEQSDCIYTIYNSNVLGIFYQKRTFSTPLFEEDLIYIKKITNDFKSIMYHELTHLLDAKFFNVFDSGNYYERPQEIRAYINQIFILVKQEIDLMIETHKISYFDNKNNLIKIINKITNKIFKRYITKENYKHIYEKVEEITIRYIKNLNMKEKSRQSLIIKS